MAHEGSPDTLAELAARVADPALRSLIEAGDAAGMEARMDTRGKKEEAPLGATDFGICSSAVALVLQGEPRTTPAF